MVVLQHGRKTPGLIR